MNDPKQLVKRADFWAAVVGLIAVLALALFDVQVDQEAILAGILAIVGIFTGSVANSEYQERKVKEKEIEKQTKVEVAQAAAPGMGRRADSATSAADE